VEDFLNPYLFKKLISLFINQVIKQLNKWKELKLWTIILQVESKYLCIYVMNNFRGLPAVKKNQTKPLG